MNVLRSPAHRAVFLLQPALMFDACNLLECVSMLLEGRKIASYTWPNRFDFAEGSMCDKDRDQRRPVQHREPHASDCFPRRTPYR